MARAQRRRGALHLGADSPTALAPEITAERFYLETLESVLKGSNKIMIDDAVGGQGVLPYLPLNELIGKPAAAPAQRGSGSDDERSSSLSVGAAIVVIGLVL